MKERLLVFINYFGRTSETFISDEIKFLAKHDSIDLSVLHYGVPRPEKNTFGLSMPTSSMKRWAKAPDKLNISVFKSLKYKNGLNGSLAYFIKFFKNKDFDTIYCHFGTNGKIIAQLRDLGIIPLSTKIIVRFHGLDMLFSKYPVGFYDILNGNVSKILVGSDYAYNDLLTYNLRKELLFKLPVGISKQNISSSELARSSGRCNIISVGRLVEFKGYMVGLKILRELDKLDVDFFYTIIGDGPQYNQICETIEEYNLQQKVKVIKGLEHAKVLEELQRSQIYLYPGIKDASGRAETQGLANLEAMANGLVVVASDVGGVADYILSGKTGFLCKAGSVKEFVEKIKSIMNDFNSEEITQIRQNAIEMVSQSYCQEVINSELLHILSEH